VKIQVEAGSIDWVVLARTRLIERLRAGFVLAVLGATDQPKHLKAVAEAMAERDPNARLH
jgi:hypothetical protein